MVKSELVQKLADLYPTILRKDIIKIVDIILFEIAKALSNGERVELRDVMMFETRIQKKPNIYNWKIMWRMDDNDVIGKTSKYCSRRNIFCS